MSTMAPCKELARKAAAAAGCCWDKLRNKEYVATLAAATFQHIHRGTGYCGCRGLLATFSQLTLGHKDFKQYNRQHRLARPCS